MSIWIMEINGHKFANRRMEEHRRRFGRQNLADF
jgi:hypothetical protein